MCDTRSMTGKVVSHYRVLEPLGEGGMGVVYKAEDTRLKRTVALKFLSSEVTGGGEFKERFLREAQASAALDHPNICTVYEIDRGRGADLSVDGLSRGGSAGPHRREGAVAARPRDCDRRAGGGGTCRGARPRRGPPRRQVGEYDRPRRHGGAAGREVDGLRAGSDERPLEADAGSIRAWARLPTCRPSRRRAARWTGAAISGRWAW